MAILIPGKEMPKSCSECFMNFCDGRKTVVHFAVERGDNCPLVEIPPHGRLIEESKVLDIVSEWCPDDDGSVGKVGDLREMLDEIEALPTIIEAEEGE